MNFSSNDSKKTKQQLIDELNSLRCQLGTPRHATSDTSEDPEIEGAKETFTILNQRQDVLAKAFELTTDAIIFVDDQLRISHFNQGAEHTFGYSTSEVLGQPLNILLPETFRDNHDKYIQDYAVL